METLSTKVDIRLTPAEARRVAQAAKLSGMRRSAFARLALALACARIEKQAQQVSK